MKKIQLSIPEPCHQNWDDMTPTQQGRFCNACAKQVIDFSAMSDTEVLNYFSIVKNENVCGRAWPDQLDRTIAAMPKKKFYWYLNYVIAFFLLFGKSSKAKAQGAMVYLAADTSKTVTVPVKKQHTKKLTISGSIKDENGQGIPYASVRLLTSTNGVSADEQGNFYTKIARLNCMIEISALGYETKQVLINDVSEKEIVLTKTNQLMKEVVINSNDNIRCGRMVGGSIRIVSDDMIRSLTVKDSLTNWISNFNPAIKIYPNPVPKGNVFTLALNLKQTGNYTLKITDAAGRLMEERKINTTVKQHREQLLTGNTWSGGIYYVSVIDEKGKPAGTGSFAVQ